MVRANLRSSIAKDGGGSNCRAHVDRQTRFCRTFPIYSDPVSDPEYLTELPYTLSRMAPPRVSIGVSLRGLGRNRGASGADRAGIFAPRATGRRLPVLRREGLSTGPQGLNARGFWLPFRPIHMHFIGHSPDAPEQDSRTRVRPLIPIPC